MKIRCKGRLHPVEIRKDSSNCCGAEPIRVSVGQVVRCKYSSSSLRVNVSGVRGGQISIKLRDDLGALALVAYVHKTSQGDYIPEQSSRSSLVLEK